MNYTPNQQFAQQYLGQQINTASPAQQVVMLYDGAIRFMLKAQAAIHENNIQERCNNNQRALQIINYLTEILDIENGGEISLRLLRIYTHISNQILQVDINNDPAIVDTILPHLKALRQSWVEIDKQHQGGAQIKAQAQKEAQAKKEESPSSPKPQNSTTQQSSSPQIKRSAIA